MPLFEWSDEPGLLWPVTVEEDRAAYAVWAATHDGNDPGEDDPDG